MGVFLVFLALGVVCAVIIIVGNVIERNRRYYDADVFYWVGGIGCACAVIAMLFCGLFALIVGCRRQVKYQQHELTYKVISSKLDTAEENYYLFVDEINEYNNAILEDRYWADNLWVNWYHNGKIQYLPLIGENADNV